MKRIFIGITGDYKPFSFFNNHTKTYEGFDVEMAYLFSSCLKKEIKFVKTTWPTLEKELEEDHFDMAMGGISITDKRKEKFIFSLPIISDGKIALVSKKNEKRFQTLADIDVPGVRLIANPGGSNEKFVRSVIRNADIVIEDNIERIFDRLENGNVDVMITDRLEAFFRQSVHPTLCAVSPDKLFIENHISYMFSKKSLMLRNEVNKCLCSIFERGEISKLFKKFFNFCEIEMLMKWAKF